MRRLLATAALCAIVLTGAACSNDSGDTSQAGAAGTASATAPAAAATSGNSPEICAATVKGLNDLAAQVNQELSANMAADPDKAVAKLHELLTQSVALIRAQAARAEEAQLKTAMTQYADLLETNLAKINTAADLQNVEALMASPEVATVESRLNTLCPQ